VRLRLPNTLKGSGGRAQTQVRVGRHRARLYVNRRKRLRRPNERTIHRRFPTVRPLVTVVRAADDAPTRNLSERDAPLLCPRPNALVSLEGPSIAGLLVDPETKWTNLLAKLL
jgi:hypothetical protein